MEELQKKVDTLTEEVNKLTQEINNMKEQARKEGRNYTQNKVFTERVTFRGEVYDKSGTKVIN